MTENTFNCKLSIINRILIDSNQNLSRMLDIIIKDNEKRDKINLEIIKKKFKKYSLIETKTIDECKEIVRLLNTCNCCDRHNTNKIKPRDFDNYQGIPKVFYPNNRSQEDLEIQWIKCDCHCRMMSRMIYRNYCYECE